MKHCLAWGRVSWLPTKPKQMLKQQMTNLRKSANKKQSKANVQFYLVRLMCCYTVCYLLLSAVVAVSETILTGLPLISRTWLTAVHTEQENILNFNEKQFQENKDYRHCSVHDLKWRCMFTCTHLHMWTPYTCSHTAVSLEVQQTWQTGHLSHIPFPYLFEDWKMSQTRELCIRTIPHETMIHMHVHSHKPIRERRILSHMPLLTHTDLTTYIRWRCSIR